MSLMSGAWSKSRIKHVARLSYGLGQPPPLSDVGIPILRATNISRGKISPVGLIRADEADLPLDRVPLLCAGEILVVRSGAYTGDSALVTQEWEGSSPGYDLRLTPTNVYPDYLAYCLLSSFVIQQVNIAKSRAAQPHLNAEELGEVTVELPSFEEQWRIADFLDAETERIDRMQLGTRRQASLLSEHLNESIRVATTVGRGHSRDTGISWMPRMNHEWRLLKVSHAFGTGSGTTPTSDRPEYFDGPYPWVNSADINDGEIYASGKSVTAKALSDFSALKIHPSGSLVVALYGQGATKGKVGLLRINACLNQACCALIPAGSITAEYASYWFRAHKDGIVGLALGAGQPNLSQELIRQLKIPTPQIPEQRRIVDALRGMEQEARRRSDLLRSRERLLSERRTSLITAAVTGQIDVSTASGRGIED